MIFTSNPILATLAGMLQKLSVELPSAKQISMAMNLGGVKKDDEGIHFP
jgi:hypothetical protein